MYTNFLCTLDSVGFSSPLIFLSFFASIVEMTSLAKKFATFVEIGTISTTLEITHVVPLDTIAPIPTIENAPMVEPNPKPSSWVSMEAKAISSLKEKANKAKKKRAPQNATIVSDSESSNS